MKTIPFNLKMKVLSIIFGLIISIPVLSQVTNVDCSNGQCVLSCGPTNPTCTGSVFSVNPSTKNCTGYDCVVGDIFSTISSSGQNLNSVNISSDLILKPHNVKISIDNGVAPGQDLTVNLNAKNPTWDYASSFSLFTDNLNQVSINLNGYSGQKGKDSSEICAEKIKNGDYGAGVQSYFNTRRSSDPQIDQNRCDLQDLNYMQQFSFSCDDPSYSEINVSNPTVSVQKIRTRSRCSAVAFTSDCVKKKVNVNCNYQLWSTRANRPLTADDVGYKSWVGTKTSGWNPAYSGQGRYESLGSSFSYQLCSTGSFDSCASGSSGFSLYPGSPNACGSGQYPKSNTAFNSMSISDQASCNVVLASSGTFWTGTVSYYRQITTVNRKKITFVPLTKNNYVLGPFDESSFTSESNRLGGIAGFCQSYMTSENIPAGSGSAAIDFFSGIYAESTVQDTDVAFTAVYDNKGIPWESTAISNPNWSSETGVQHSGANTCFSRTENNPDYNPSCDPNSYPFPSCAPATISKTYCRASIWKATAGSTVAYTNESSWLTETTPTFTTCRSGYTLVRNNYLTLVQHADSPALCASATDSRDPYNRATWQYTGEAQETSFGTESVSCSIGSCAVNSSVSDLDRSVDVIIPGSGEDGTEQGRGLIFAYDIKNITQSALSGQAGSKGDSDIQIGSQVRICAKINDATAGINTPEAKNPFVSFRRYNWQSIKSSNVGNNGVPPRQNGKKIEIFKKIDPGARYFLEKALN